MDCFTVDVALKMAELRPPFQLCTIWPHPHTGLQVRYIGVSNETSWGVCEFAWLAKSMNLPKIQTIQNSYSLLVSGGLSLHQKEVCLQAGMRAPDHADFLLAAGKKGCCVCMQRGSRDGR